MSFRYPAATQLKRDLFRPLVPTTLSMMAGCWYKVHSVGSASEWDTVMAWSDSSWYQALAVQYDQNLDPYWQQYDAIDYYTVPFYKNASASPLETWMYTTYRISTTYCRAANIDENGAPYNYAYTAFPTGETTITYSAIDIPSSTESSMSIAEFWWASPDPFAHLGNTALPEPILRQIAYHSPWSLPEVAGKIIWYNSFREGVFTAAPGDFWTNADLSKTTINNDVNNPYLGDNPPLSANYVRPYNLAPPPLIV